MSIPGLFRFPNPVNEVSARLVAAGVAVMSTLAIALQQPWLLAVVAYGFVARALTGPTLSPLGQLVTRGIVPRLPFEKRLTPGPPKRFAQTVGAVLTVTAVALYFGAGLHTAAYALAGAIVFFATLESVFNLCVGCKVFALLMRLRLIPERVCADCADVWARAS